MMQINRIVQKLHRQGAFLKARQVKAVGYDVFEPISARARANAVLPEAARRVLQGRTGGAHQP
jgi:hypothetical protein